MGSRLTTSPQTQQVSRQHPDPAGEQYPVMAAAVRAIAAAHGWPLSDCRVWLDYHSVPQANLKCQQLAIDSIFLYASEADAFCACAPVCNLELYTRAALGYEVIKAQVLVPPADELAAARADTAWLEAVADACVHYDYDCSYYY